MDFKFLTTEEAAAYLKMSKSLLNYHVRAGNLKAIMRSGRRFFEKSDLDEFAKTRRKRGQKMPAKEGLYTAWQLTDLLKVSRQQATVIAKSQSWRVERGYYDKKMVDQFLGMKTNSK